MKARQDDKVRATLKISEAALIAGTGEKAIRKGIEDGSIPHLRFGRNILIPRSAFMRWLDNPGAVNGIQPRITKKTAMIDQPISSQ
ncbi:helix-turn-helix domain-containing protein [Acidobacterium sp. S8]|uniref:helix-turn-helix domain-containing protein n=1 Tax=Acidobacterium sp. S8 TaxID=1641854 RepID=UPI00131C8020|nr:helix-turn-helix domain-containing protein [Acidobacterium sp. S8]